MGRHYEPIINEEGTLGSHRPSVRLGKAVGAGRITRKEANSIIKRLMEKYLDRIKEPPKGRDLNQCYDLQTMQPDDELRRLYDEVIGELGGYGIRFK